MIAIVDYGAGNLRSVKKAFDYIGAESRLISSPDELDAVDKLVLPGVGAFGAAIERLKKSAFYPIIGAWLESNRSFLGICLGMQLLFQSSTESQGIEGFGLFKGATLRFVTGKVPQIGWNQIQKIKESRLFEGIDDGSFFYFLHGYYIAPQDMTIVTATTDYGIIYPSVIERGNISAVQFHPEKSGQSGLRLLKNWVELC